MKFDPEKHLEKKDAGVYLMRLAYDIPAKVKRWGALITLGWLMGSLEVEGSRVHMQQHEAEKREKNKP